MGEKAEGQIKEQKEQLEKQVAETRNGAEQAIKAAVAMKDKAVAEMDNKLKEKEAEAGKVKEQAEKEKAEIQKQVEAAEAAETKGKEEMKKQLSGKLAEVVKKMGEEAEETKKTAAGDLDLAYQKSVDLSNMIAKLKDKYSKDVVPPPSAKDIIDSVKAE